VVPVVQGPESVLVRRGRGGDEATSREQRKRGGVGKRVKLGFHSGAQAINFNIGNHTFRLILYKEVFTQNCIC